MDGTRSGRSERRRRVATTRRTTNDDEIVTSFSESGREKARDILTDPGSAIAALGRRRRPIDRYGRVRRGRRARARENTAGEPNRGRERRRVVAIDGRGNSNRARTTPAALRAFTWPTIPWDTFLASKASSRPRPRMCECAPMRSMRVRSLTSATFTPSPPSAIVLVRVTIRRFEEWRKIALTARASLLRIEVQRRRPVGFRDARLADVSIPIFALQIKKSPAGGETQQRSRRETRWGARACQPSSRAGARRRWRRRVSSCPRTRRRRARLRIGTRGGSGTGRGMARDARKPDAATTTRSRMRRTRRTTPSRTR